MTQTNLSSALGSCITIAGSSWSLTQGQLERARSAGPVIVTNSTIYSAPWAAACYGYDRAWWDVHAAKVREEAPDAILATMNQEAAKAHDLRLVGVGARLPGSSSGHQAVLWAALMGFTQIACIGMDMAYGPSGERHYHGGHHPECATHAFPAEDWRLDFSRLVDRLRYNGIHVAQCSAGWKPMRGVLGMTLERWLQDRRTEE